MTKKISGEVALKAGNEKYVLRLDFAGIAEIEEIFDCGIMTLVKRFGDPRVSDFAKILAVMLDVDETDALNILQEAGFEVGAKAIAECLQGTLTPKTPGKPKPRRTRAPAQKTQTA